MLGCTRVWWKSQALRAPPPHPQPTPHASGAPWSERFRPRVLNATGPRHKATRARGTGAEGIPGARDSV